MAKENLVKKLGRNVRKKVMPYVLSAFLLGGLSAHYGCENFTDPSNPENPEKPVAMLVANPTKGDAPLFVELDGSLSYAKKGSIEKYHWDFDGDGNTDVISPQSTINHTYENVGTYNASLIVEDSQGQKSDKALEKIVVNEEIVSLGQIAFTGIPLNYYNQDIYSGETIHRIKDNKIELRNIKRLTIDPGQDLEPAWSPDGSKIAFTTNREDVDGDGYEDISIYIMNADGNNPRRLTPDIELAMSPHWCVNDKIVFTFVNSGYMGVASINPDGTDYTELFSEPGGPTTPWAYPNCSPDGSKIAFGTRKDGNWEIYTMNSDGSNLERITNDPAIDGQPVFLPDSSGIIFTSNRENEFDLYLMNLYDYNLTRLTYALGTEIEPDISQNGKYVIFTHFVGVTERPQLYLAESINADDSTKWIQLTTEGGNNYPAWKPEREDQNLN